MDERTRFSALIHGVRGTTVAYLEANTRRLNRSSHLVARFTEACAAWEEGRSQNARQITETVNELLIAKCLLQDALCQSVEYEKPLGATRKTIDFLFHTTDGNRIFYDVKSVLPEDRDAAGRYAKAMRGGRFAPGTDLTLEGELKGELAHHRFTCREKFLAHSLELEEKIRLVPGREDGRTFFRMVFCSDGFRWRQDELEDFAETYSTLRNPWDHFAAMEAHDLKQKGRTLDRTIHGFCYFERGLGVPEPTVFRCDVRVPGTGL